MELHRRAGDRVALVDEHHRDEPPPLGVRGVPGGLKGVYLVVVEISPFRGAGVSAGADEGFYVAPPDIAGFTHRPPRDDRHPCSRAGDSLDRSRNIRGAAICAACLRRPSRRYSRSVGT